MFSTHWRSRRVLKDREHRFLDLLANQAADLLERQEADRSRREDDRRKNEFIAMLSHELRNPLVPIRNGIRLLKSVPDPEGVLAKIHPMMERQMDQTVRLVDDLLDVSRISSGRIEISPVPTAIDTIIAAALESHRGQILERRIDLRVDVAEPQRVVNADFTRVVQVISNLVSNAVKFSPVGAPVELTASFVPAESTQLSTLLLSVRDKGVGIAPQELPRIFDFFASSGLRGSSTTSGLGVGLAIARRIAEMHRGTLTASSQGVGFGSEFILKLPNNGSGASIPAAPTAPSPTTRGLRVLVVDDNRDIADSTVLMLRAMGIDADAKYDGAAAIDSVGSARPAIVLSDIGMPEMDGYELCRRLRLRHGNDLRIVAITGWGQEADRVQAREAGFDAHLTKPVDATALESLLVELKMNPVA